MHLSETGARNHIRLTCCHVSSLVDTKTFSGLGVGRYVAPAADRGDLADEHEKHRVIVGDARALTPEPALETKGFELRRWPTAVADFGDVESVKATYYGEMEALIKRATGCERVLVFDHTLREGGTSGAQKSLNVLGDAGKAAGAVRRAHCDYSAASAPERLRQLASGGSYTGAELSEEEREEVMCGRFAFVNAWRSIDSEHAVQESPLALLDPDTVRPEEVVPYKMVFADRVGENLALLHGETHRWLYYPRMVRDEVLLFKTYDSHEGGARMVFHTAVEDEASPADAPPRRSIEVRAVASFPRERPPRFFDMQHSNNAARVRLWLRKKGLPDGAVDTTVIKYADLQSDEYEKVNPLRKVPALIDAFGKPLFESDVILNYLEDRFAGQGAAPHFTPGSAEDRAFVRLLIRIHDTYIASPNSTQPGFSHTQGAMYLAPYETPFCPPQRAMPDRATRAAKLAEIWKQLLWLEAQCRGPYLAGAAVSLADFTWFPTAVFMRFMLPLVFEWPAVFDEVRVQSCAASKGVGNQLTTAPLYWPLRGAPVNARGGMLGRLKKSIPPGP